MVVVIKALILYAMGMVSMALVHVYTMHGVSSDMVVGLTLVLVVGSILVLLYIKQQCINGKSKYIDVRTKNLMNNEIKMNLAESLYHELLTPTILAIRLHQRLQQRGTGMIMNLETKKKYNNTIALSLDTIVNTLNLLKSSKEIRYNRDSLPVPSVVKGALDTIFEFLPRKFDTEMKNFDTYENICVDKISTGEMVTLISHMFKNAIEAHATKIIVELDEEVIDNKLKIYILDNGHGLCDKNGTLLKTVSIDSIFDYGISSKNPKDIPQTNVSGMAVLLKTLGIGITEAPMGPPDGTRGTGLYMVKSRLREIGGEIAVLRTSGAGTKFVIVVPIKPCPKLMKGDKNE